MIYLVEDGNTYEMEQAEYSVTQLWSDIGGAGGTILIELFKTEFFHFRSYAWHIICNTNWRCRLPLFIPLENISSWFNRRKNKVYMLGTFY